jgi:hypothetical protein
MCEAPILPSCLIHPRAWKGNSQNFAINGVLGSWYTGRNLNEREARLFHRSPPIQWYIGTRPEESHFLVAHHNRGG